MMFMVSFDVVKEKVRELVNTKRFEHCVLVAIEAEKLAKYYEINPEEAKMVGIAHDIAKDFSDEENEYWANKGNLDKKILEDSYRKMVHADIGAVVCKEWFSFSEEMCEAIKYHTVANDVMNTLDKIIFLADKIGRKDIPEDIKDLKQIAYEDLDKAMVYFLEREQIKLQEEGRDLLPLAKILLDKLRGE